MAANGSGIPSFNDFIQAGRQKKKAEKLANDLLGSKNRRASAPGAGGANNRRTPNVLSLASRIGVTKRSASTSKPAVANKLHTRLTQLQRTQSLSNLGDATTKDLFSHKNVTNSRNTQVNAPGGISIKGAAGPYMVVASNFAPGTTAADIEAVMAPVGGSMEYCKLVASSPTVIAEMAFLDKSGAENVISMFNNKKADGRLLYVYMKHGAPHQFTKQRQQPPVVARDDNMELDQEERLPPTGPRRAETQYQDGRYGFTDNYSPRNQRRGREPKEESRLFSDRMIGRDDGRYRR